MTTSNAYVPETRFGFWFLGTRIWRDHVLTIAIDDLRRLPDAPFPAAPVIADVGCGQGNSLSLLQAAFAPSRLIGIEFDGHSLDIARTLLAREGLHVELKQTDCAAIDLPDASVDMVFCHQTVHHLLRQEEAMREFYRILKPGGRLLFAESTRAYIHSWIIRLLFRHPMHVQRTADEYKAMIRDAGFVFEAKNVSEPYLWWSRSDLGAFEWFGFGVPKEREETLVNLVATKPAA
ncbi:class I SAM-dependent methyltransferase [Denitromonas sp.]|uniref:class I SAM-dependent methyltransferase n=1 Tax=Denitromonas sp. TaxID=2734609 RepID=UPI003A88BABC